MQEPVRSASVGVDAYARGMTQWRSDCGMFDTPCGLCWVLQLDHDTEVLGHEWLVPDSEAITDEEAQARVRTTVRERNGNYCAPLPPPAERRRIREAAGLTQDQVGDELHISRHTISKFERRAGWVDGRRLPGREPSDAVRVSYSELLRRLETLGG